MKKYQKIESDVSRARFAEITDNQNTVDNISESVNVIDNSLKDRKYITISDKNKIIESINDLKTSLDCLIVVDETVLNDSYLDANYIDTLRLSLYYKSEINKLWYWWDNTKSKWLECDWEEDDEICKTQFKPINIEKERVIIPNWVNIENVDLDNPEINGASVILCGNNYVDYKKGQWYTRGVVKNGDIFEVCNYEDSDEEYCSTQSMIDYTTHIQFLYNPNNHQLVYFEE